MDSLLQRTARLYRNPWPLLIILTAITVFLGFGLPNLVVDNDVKSMLPKKDPSRALTELYDKETNFGASNAALIGVQSSDIFGLETLTYIKQVDDALNDLNRTLPIQQLGKLLGLSAGEAEKVVGDLRSVGINDFNYHDTLGKLIRDPTKLQKQFGWDDALAKKVARAAQGIDDDKLFAVYQTPLGKINSLVSADYITAEDEALVSKKLIPDGELTPENLAGLKERVQSWDTYEGTLVSKDLSLTAITVILKTEDKDVKTAFNVELMKLIANPPAGIEVFASGEPVIVNHLAVAMAKDMPVLVPLMFLVLLVVLFFCFRSLQGIVFPLLLTLVSAVWTFGLMGYLAVPLTVIGSMIPILLMAIVSAYGIHQMTHFYEDPHPLKFDVLHHNARSVGLAILLSGLTVMIGFGSMIALDFIPIRNFGLFTAFGDLVGVLAALYLLPALLMLGKKEKPVRPIVAEEDRKDLISGLLKATKALGHQHPGRVVVGVGILTLLVAGGSFLVKSDLDLVKFFPLNDTIRVADRVMNSKMAGTKSLSIVLDSDLRDPLTRQGNPDTLVQLPNPAVLKKIDQFSKDVQVKFPNVRKVSSYSDVLKKMNQVMNGGAASDYVIPDDPALISQYMVIFSGDTQSLMTVNHDKLRIMVMMNSGSLDVTHQVAEYAKAYFDDSFRSAQHFTVHVVGEQQISYMANQTLLKGTVESIFACLIIVFLLLIIVLRSFWMSLIAVVPIVLCLAINFGYLGLTGTELNTATALVSSIGIGIGIDFSIHFITWYRRELLVDRNVLAAVDRTILHKGRAIVYNLLVIVGGFGVLIGSQMAPMRDFGLLTALCLTVTAFGALVVVPAILRLLARRNFRFLYLGVKKANPTALAEE